MKAHKSSLRVRILCWCFPFTDVLSVCTDIEVNVRGICVGLSTFSESLLCQTSKTSHCLNTCDRYFLVPRCSTITDYQMIVSNDLIIKSFDTGFQLSV
jgi:hypothetical protein